jgi:hypothetical protein
VRALHSDGMIEKNAIEKYGRYESIKLNSKRKNEIPEKYQYPKLINMTISLNLLNIPKPLNILKPQLPQRRQASQAPKAFVDGSGEAGAPRAPRAEEV